MRFNKQELVAAASQSSQNFDREGILVLKEKQDGFFRRTEGNIPRWFRLRGNLLFYLREAEQLSEPLGVIVLGRHQIKLQTQDENGHWPFQIVWDNGVCYRMATFLESERTLWIKAIQLSSYENLKTQISELKDKLTRLRPILDISTWRAQRGIVTDGGSVPWCSMALSCDNLLCSALGRPPAARVSVLVRCGPRRRVRYASTETQERSSNPSFCKTILFDAHDGLTGDTLVTLVVGDVREPVSETVAPLGQASLRLSTIQEAQGLRVPLIRESRTVGFITVNGWSLEPTRAGPSPGHGSPLDAGPSPGHGSPLDAPLKTQCHRRSQSLPPRLGLKLKYPSTSGLLRENLPNSHRVTYRFHSGLGGDITVHEVMSEARVCFQLPVQLIDIYIKREKELLQELLQIGEMGGQWKTKQLELIHTHVSLLKHYWHSKKSLQSVDEGIYFKKSSQKGDSSLECAPVNLHVQRMWVHNDTLTNSGYLDTVTAGAFTAHAHSSAHGGLIRLVQQAKDVNNSTATFNSANASSIQAAYENIVAVRGLRDEASDLMHTIATLAQSDGDVAPHVQALIHKTRAMMGLWQPAAVDEALSFVLWHKAKPHANGLVDGSNQPPSTIERLMEQFSKFEALSADYEIDVASSSCSSKDTSPTVEGPPLSASVPNICNNKMAAPHAINDIKEGTELEFHNDYFKSEVANSERYSSLRLSKKANESQRSSIDGVARNLNGDMKGSSSLEQVSYNRLMGNLDLDDKRKGAGFRRESFSMVGMAREAEGGEGQAAAATDVEARLAAVLDALQPEAAPEESNPARIDLIRSRLEALRSSMAALVRRLLLAHATLRLRSEAPQWTRLNATLQTRRDACFSQALTTVTSGLVVWLNSARGALAPRLLAGGLGPLCGFEGLLSLYAEERAMWGDMVVAVEDLHTVLFTVARADSCPNWLPYVSGSRGAVTVHIPVSDSLYNKFTAKERSFTITAVFFNIGINQKASLAEALGEARPQAQSNWDGCERLHHYYHSYRKIFPDEILNAARASARTKPLEEVMENLRAAVHKPAPRPVQVLHLAAHATRLMNGVRFTSCKSAKDRTGMSVTREQWCTLAADYHLAGHELNTALSILRSEGCRRENTLKNIGIRKYAFTKKQVAALPPEYRPPAGSYGANQT